MEKVEEKMERLTNRQSEVEGKVQNFEKMLDNIEKDIYMDDSEFDLEIVCPYCNFTFMLDPNETRDEVECPECKNLIEIDWDGECIDDGCNGHCAGCGNGCTDNDIDDDDSDEDDM